MNIDKIYVRGRFEATRFDIQQRVLVISVTDPESDAPVFKHFCVMDEADVLRLRFHDIDSTRYDDAFLGAAARDYTPMHSFHAKQILPFLDHRLREGVSVLLIHCEAGVSRSPSIAMAVCDALGLDRDIIDWIRNPNGNAPNEHVYITTMEAMQ